MLSLLTYMLVVIHMVTQMLRVPRTGEGSLCSYWRQAQVRHKTLNLRTMAICQHVRQSDYVITQLLYDTNHPHKIVHVRLRQSYVQVFAHLQLYALIA